MNESISVAMAKIYAYDQERPALIAAGNQALVRLAPIALQPTDQARTIGRFLLGLYNGEEFPFDLTELRGLDLDLFQDCLSVLVMDYSPELEVHERVPNGNAIWQRLIELWTPEAA
ncbi:hypothetical protein ABR147_001526 [Pseudomonas aeruginosa]|uniref:DUF7673 family protein n=1 Tax=Pseudomonas aeruginosa TaxID=287 RepID=UPI000EABE1BA|nr:hypothetical protein [Pseudomonas aeruginosa]EIU6915705.1 hypothetical protein [Pseudomonas aeruginosa]EKI0102542.1 hypothetical protein [Pseudomonas aeruginosa]EKT8184753.1 hypothetical protein [Pseudomonas aeruginosa]EKW9851901.1 hypothetical protein [Pseudomonas aeruginosa]ELF4136623.1 hypothetical protein [Pseudomonas aeruginosa]